MKWRTSPRKFKKGVYVSNIPNQLFILESETKLVINALTYIRSK